MKEDKTEGIIDEAAVDASQNGRSAKKGLGTASCLGVFLGSGLGLLVAVVLVAGMWLLLLGMMVAAPPLEFMGRIEAFMNGALTLSVALLLGLPLLGGIVGGTASASVMALWRKIRERPQPAPRKADLPAPTAVSATAPPDEAEATAVPTVTSPPPKAETPLRPSRRPSPAGLLARSIAIWLALFLVAFVVGLVALNATAPAQPEENITGWLIFLTVLLAGHALATYLAFTSLLPGVGLAGWWQGRQRVEGTAVAPILPAFFLGTAVALLVTLAAFFVGGLLRENASLSGIVMLLGMLLGLVSGVLLAWISYRRNQK